MDVSLSVIIPVYNEERTVASIIECVRTWGRANEIIIVNDGSTDRTIHAVQQFNGIVRIISYKTNHGKGYALVKGIESGMSDYLLFLDGDLLGLTHKTLDALVRPVFLGRCDMTIGKRMLPRHASVDYFETLGGERAVKRDDVVPLLPKIKRAGYGVELILNKAYEKKRVQYVPMPFVSILVKYEKQNFPDAMVSYIKEARDLLGHIVRQQAFDLPPQARHIFRMILGYLRQTLDYFQ